MSGFGGTGGGWAALCSLGGATGGDGELLIGEGVFPNKIDRLNS